jgi:hypothetical protein
MPIYDNFVLTLLYCIGCRVYLSSSRGEEHGPADVTVFNTYSRPAAPGHAEQRNICRVPLAALLWSQAETFLCVIYITQLVLLSKSPQNLHNSSQGLFARVAQLVSA